MIQNRALRSSGIFFLAAAIGVLGGLLGVVFLQGVQALQTLFMGQGGSVVEAGIRLPIWARILVPTLGGLCAGVLLLSIGNRRGPFGISDVMELVLTRRGSIRPLHSIVQIASSAMSIASGGSIGREGANSQFGATVASILGDSCNVNSRTRTILLGCGLAAGMASAYKAPIAGALFVMEVVLGNFAMDVLAPIVVASVLSTLVTQAFVDWQPLYQESVKLESWYLVLSAMVLGAMCGVGGVGFRRSLSFAATVFQRIRVPAPIKMALGGCAVGMIGVWFPEVWGNGQVAIQTLTDQTVAPTLTILAGLLVMKVAATAITVGSGGIGGVFTPNLVVGAAFGTAFSNVVTLLDPRHGDNRVAFALVGMAGMCAATTHAPITAIILIFEMTGDYDLILPLMLCSIIGSLVARLIDSDSMYTARLRERGHEVHTGIEQLAIHSNYVRDIRRDDHVSIHEHTKFDAVLEEFRAARRDTIYVVGDGDRLLGQVHLHDVKFYINDPTLGSVVIAADLTRPIPHVTEDESLASIVDRFDDADLDELPVVHGETDGRLTGRVTRRDLVTCLSEEVLGQRSMRAKIDIEQSDESNFVQLPADSAIDAIPIPHNLAGMSLGSLDLAADYSVHPLVYVHHDEHGREQRVLPQPETLLAEGGRLVVIGTQGAIDSMRREIGAEG